MSAPPEKPVVEPPPGGDTGLHERALHLRIRQQEILSELGVLALQGAGFTELLERTARLTAEGLQAEYSKVRLREELATAMHSTEAGIQVLLEADPQVLKGIEAVAEARKMAERSVASK